MLLPFSVSIWGLIQKSVCNILLGGGTECMSVPGCKLSSCVYAFFGTQIEGEIVLVLAL